MTKKNYTVITGASKGLGLEFARMCAKMSQNLILISLPGENLIHTGKCLAQNNNIDIQTYETDLTRTENLNKVCDWIISEYSVNMLINNAGIGSCDDFLKCDTDYINNIIQLNITATVILTHKLLPLLKNQAQAYILNIASMASFGPMPYKTVYPASKAFIYSFSRGLYSELKNTNVFVSVAHPGGMPTNDEISARINSHSSLIKSTILSPEKTARICITQLLKKEPLILPGAMNKVSWLFFKLCPVWIRLKIFKKSLLKELHLKTVLT